MSQSGLLPVADYTGTAKFVYTRAFVGADPESAPPLAGMALGPFLTQVDTTHILADA